MSKAFSDEHAPIINAGTPESTDDTKVLADGKEQKTVDETMELLGTGKFQLKMFFLCGLAFMADAIEVMILSFLQVLVKDEWSLSGNEQATVTAIVFAGELFGAMFWGVVADHYGRRRGYLYSTIIVAIFGALSALSPSYTALLACRALVGFGVSGLVIPFDLLAELTPTSRRGQLLMATNFFWTFGSIYVACIAWAVVDSVGWRLMAFLASLPLVLATFLFPILPESPRWLLVKGRHDEATDILKRIAKENGKSDNLVPILKATANTQKEGTFWDLLTPSLRQTTTILWIIWCGYGFTYYGLVLSMPRILREASDSGTHPPGTGADSTIKDSQKFDYAKIFAATFCEMIGVFITMLVIDRWGRRKTQSFLYLCAGLAMIPLSMASSMTSATLTFFAGIGRAAIMGASCATWVITPEVYPTFVRGTGHGTANAVARIGAGTSPYWCDSESLSVGTVMGAYCAVNLVVAFVAWFLPETSGQTLDSQSEEPESINIVSQNDSLTLESAKNKQIIVAL